MNSRKSEGTFHVMSGVAGLAIVALAWIEARTFPLQDLQEGLGAAFFPYLVLGIIAVLGTALILLGTALGVRLSIPDKVDSHLHSAAKLFALFVAYTLAFAFFGLLVPAILFLVIAMRVLGASWRGALVVGSLAAGAIYALFVVGFGVPMP